MKETGYILAAGTHLSSGGSLIGYAPAAHQSRQDGAIGYHEKHITLALAGRLAASVLTSIH